MEDRAKFWLQLAVPTVASFLLGGFGLFLLAQFKEQLPEWFYNALIVVIYVVFVAILIFFIILIIRTAFGDWLKRLTSLIKRKRQQRARIKLTKEWYAKWRELGLILFNVAKKKWKPTKKQDEDFSRLRDWFRINRTEFLHIWHGFNNHRRNMAHEKSGSSSSLGYKVFFESHDDPFSYFYQPLSIDQLEHLLGYRHNEMPAVMLTLKELMDECVEWVSQE